MPAADGLSIFIAIKFVSQLAKPFDEWKAYEMGLIDIDGNKIKEPKTPEEKKQFSSWLNLIRNLKRMLVKLPGGRSQIASLAVAFMMLKDGIERKSGQKISKEALHNVIETVGKGISLKSSALKVQKLDEETKYLIDDDFHLFDDETSTSCKIIGESISNPELVLVRTENASEILVWKKFLVPTGS